ncbi:MAG: hypothetical protein CL843_20095 [Crocinitomicaceae bacterium]|nr:hypothetical protein [Crocinitomicaceae bacterium]MAX82467.1 hypothetical protein [Crocinitomicaceae bacterium]|tara:strand:+ start:5884 stop:6126 length:243 start_codon:yes stop_codon:yes gene_type:complete
MQIPVIRRIVEEYSLEQLQNAEAALLEEQPIEIDVDGNDEGEQLTHIMAAIWIKQEMEKEDIPIGKAVRNYTVKVRNSIS